MAGGSGLMDDAIPDGGYGWVICMSAFVIQFYTIGVTYTFGVLMVALMDPIQGFGTSETVTAWIGSIQPFLLYFTGIVCGSLIERFGFRAVTISGCLLSVIGFISSAFATNVYVLYFTYGGLTGVGNGLMYVTCMVAVQHYFSKRRALATGIAVAGSGLGTLVFSYVTQVLIQETGWRKTLIIEGVMMLVCVFFGALMRPLPAKADSSKYSLVEASSQVDGEIVNHEVPVGIEEADVCCSCFGGAAGRAKHDCIDWSLYKDPKFNLIVVALFCFAMNLHVPYTFTPNRAIKLGIHPEKAALLVSIMGISNVSSRFLFGFIADRSESMRFIIGGLSLCIGGLMSALTPFYSTYTTMAIYSFMFGVCTGCFASLYPVLMVDFFGMERIGKVIGQAIGTHSPVFLIAAPLSGLIIDKTGNIDLPFIIVGIVGAAGGLIFFTIAFFRSSRTGYERINPDRRRTRMSFMSESFSY